MNEQQKPSVWGKLIGYSIKTIFILYLIPAAIFFLLLMLASPQDEGILANQEEVQVLVATGKALAWPYFLLRQNKPQNPQNSQSNPQNNSIPAKVEDQQIDVKYSTFPPNLPRSLQEFIKATEVMLAMSTLIADGKLSIDKKEDQKKLMVYLTRAYAHALEIDPQELNAIYPSWGDHARDEFIKAMGINKEVVETHNEQMAIENEKLSVAWGQFMQSNLPAIAKAIKKKYGYDYPLMMDKETEEKIRRIAK